MRRFFRWAGLFVLLTGPPVALGMFLARFEFPEWGLFGGGFVYGAIVIRWILKF